METKTYYMGYYDTNNHFVVIFSNSNLETMRRVKKRLEASRPQVKLEIKKRG